MLTQAPKGTKDLLPQDAYRFQAVEAVEKRIAERAGYREIRTPVFEHTELFLRGVGDTTDIVQKEMYTFTDKGDRSITLKPEGTAGAVRALVEHSLYAGPLPVKMYYVNNPIFRYEAPQSGRLREHHQFGCECFGAAEPSCDAELISIAVDVLKGLGLDNLVVNINSIGCPECRKVYHEKLRAFLSERLDKLCETCRGRFEKNPLRILDCKVESCQKQLEGAPSILDCLCDECAAHFEGLKANLDALEIPYSVDPRIVRGLDYYTKTVFEFVAGNIGAQSTVCGGGRYDGLVESLGGPALPGLGFGCGLERLLLVLQESGIALPPAPGPDVFLASADASAQDTTAQLVLALRRAGVAVEHDVTGRSLKAQLKYADKLHTRYLLILGGNELETGGGTLKNMVTGETVPVSLSAKAIAEIVSAPC